MEDRASGRTELVAARFLLALIDARALVLALGLAHIALDVYGAARDAAYAFRPAQLLQIVQALFLRVELFGYVYQPSSEMGVFSQRVNAPSVTLSTQRARLQTYERQSHTEVCVQSGADGI